jgi:signal transduction histidine kinase
MVQPQSLWKQDSRDRDTMIASNSSFRRIAIAQIERLRLERTRFSGKLHDHVAQDLSGAGIQLDLLRMDLHSAAPELDARISETQALLERAVREIRQLSYELNPDVAERAGLQSALGQLTGRYRGQFKGTLRLMFDSSAVVEPNHASAMEKVAAEAVRNAIRHARCSRIEVLVKALRGCAALEVRDDGAGFDLQRERRDPGGLGLSLMEFWAEQAGLDFAIDTGARGTSILAGARAANT